MKKTAFIVSMLLVTLSCNAGKSPSPQPEKKELTTRGPAVAGQFYPSDPKKLEQMADALLAKANPPPTKGMVTALILPHAGYQFSAQVAAYGYKKLMGEDIDTVIIIGNSHREKFDGVSIYPEGFFETPLGKVEIDSELARSIMNENSKIHFRQSAHLEEHSLEVQLPFLQRILKNFKIVPILFGNSSSYQVLAEAILKNIKGKNILLIASSDLTHYPNYQDSKSSDEKTLKAILTDNVQTLDQTIQKLESQNIPNTATFACGLDAIKTVMAVEKGLGANEIKLLNSANSGDVFGDKSRVVGYGAIGFFGERRGNLLNKFEQKKLSDIAKASVEGIVGQTKVPNFKISEPMLMENLGAFVTLREHGELRGCIGRFSPTTIPLYQVVSQMAVAAATQDSRFPQVAKNELSKLQYEISVLSPLTKIKSGNDIVLGRHGVKVMKGYNSGVFLPQVATETGWDLDKFLGELCSQKAGLPWDCWKDKDTELYTFTAQIF